MGRLSDLLEREIANFGVANEESANNTRWETASLYRGWLTGYRGVSRHRLAAILTLHIVRVALHGLAALHRLLGCGHPCTIEPIRHERQGNHGNANWSCEEHLKLG